MSKNDFELQFENEEQIDEMLGNLMEMIEAEEEKPAVLNPIRLQQMQFAYGVLRFLTRGVDAKMDYRLNEPVKSMGSITVEAKVLPFSNAEWFCRSVEFASNVEVYALTNGKVRMTLTFHNLAKPIS